MSELYARSSVEAGVARGQLNAQRNGIVGTDLRSQSWASNPLNNPATVTTNGTAESRDYNAR